ncbi:MAG: WG repeat-containing protein, partial [Bacteroidia bacterium]
MKYLKISLSVILALILYSADSTAQVYDDYDIDDVEMEEVDQPAYVPRHKQIGIRSAEGKKWLEKSGVAISSKYDQMVHHQMCYIVSSNKKFGLITKEGKELVPLKYDEIKRGATYKSGLIIKAEKGYGVVDFTGKVVVKPEYMEIIYNDLQKSVTLVRLDSNRRGLVFGSDDVYPDDLDNFTFFSDGVLASKKGKYGFLVDGKPIIPFEYDSLYFKAKKANRYQRKPKYNKKPPYLIASPSGTTKMVALKDGKHALIASDGSTILDLEYDEIYFDPLRGIYRFSKDKLWGLYVPRSGYTSKTEYTYIYTDGTKYITLTKDEKKGLIDYQGQQILPFKFDNISIQGWETYFQVEIGKKFGWYSNKGKEIIPVIYDDLDDFGSFQPKFEGLFHAKIGEKEGIIDTNGVVVPVVYDNVYSIYSGSHFVVEQDSLKGLYNVDGKLVAPIKYDFIKRNKYKGSISLILKKDGLYGLFIDDNNRIEPQFKSLRLLPDGDGHLMVPSSGKFLFKRTESVKSKFGLINQINGEIILPTKYDEIVCQVSSKDGYLFVVAKGDKYGVVNHKNVVILPFIYEHIDFKMANIYASHGYGLTAVVQKNGKYGLVNMKKFELIIPQYDHLEKVQQDGLFKAKKNGTYSLINSKNEVIHGGPFDDVSNFERGTACTFYQEKMNSIDARGVVGNEQKSITAHNGYTNFEVLKTELYEALIDTANDKLMEFCKKVAPSQHLLQFIPNNVFNGKEL